MADLQVAEGIVLDGAALRPRVGVPGARAAGAPALDRDAAAAARAQLRRQIADLERRLGDALVTAFAHQAPEAAPPAARIHGRPRGSRLLSLGELERIRDDLVARLARTRDALAVRSRDEEAARLRLERMLLEPARHRFAEVANAELGVGGCGVWRVQPRLGLLGMLMGWWEVKLSSGCPLASRAPAAAS